MKITFYIVLSYIGFLTGSTQILRTPPSDPEVESVDPTFIIFILRPVFTHLNNKISLWDRSILLLVHNAPAHPHVELSHIKVVFLSKSTATHLHPCGAGIIYTQNQYYMRQFLRHLKMHIDQSENYEHRSVCNLRKKN